MKDGGNLEEEEEAAGGCTLTRLIFPDLATTVVIIVSIESSLRLKKAPKSPWSSIANIILIR